MFDYEFAQKLIPTGKLSEKYRNDKDIQKNLKPKVDQIHSLCCFCSILILLSPKARRWLFLNVTRIGLFHLQASG